MDNFINITNPNTGNIVSINVHWMAEEGYDFETMSAVEIQELISSFDPED